MAVKNPPATIFGNILDILESVIKAFSNDVNFQNIVNLLPLFEQRRIPQSKYFLLTPYSN